MQMPIRSPAPAASTSCASSSKSRPSGPVVPAVFSNRTGQDSLSASASRTSAPDRATASSSGSFLREPAWRTTPSAPIASPSRSAWVSEASDFSLISGSGLAVLIR